MHPKVDLMVSGDLNCNWKHAEALAGMMNLEIARPACVATWHTRTQKMRDRESTSTLDYIMGTGQPQGLRKQPLVHKNNSLTHLSDHHPIAADITLSGSLDNTASVVHEDRLRQGVQPAKVWSVLEDANWPAAPFIEVAKGYDFTQVSKFQRTPVHTLLDRLRPQAKGPKATAEALPLEYTPRQRNQLTRAVTGLLCSHRDFGIEAGARMVESIRCKWPKVFYAAVKRATKSADNAIIATEFAAGHDAQGNLVPAVTFAEYLASLYFDPKRVTPRRITKIGTRI